MRVCYNNVLYICLIDHSLVLIFGVPIVITFGYDKKKLNIRQMNPQG